MSEVLAMSEEPLKLDLDAIAQELQECKGEIELAIAETEESQIVTHETLNLEFGV